MTKKKPDASRGRPPKEEDDQNVRELALAYQVVWGLGPQRARDLALAWLEGSPSWPTMLPRGSRKTAAHSRLGGFAAVCDVQRTRRRHREKQTRRLGAPRRGYGMGRRASRSGQERADPLPQGPRERFERMTDFWREIEK